jgi:hypothetical protein
VSISQKKRTQVTEAIRSASLRVLDEYMPDWENTPPDLMSAEEKHLFDALAELERQVTLSVEGVLTK